MVVFIFDKYSFFALLMPTGPDSPQKGHSASFWLIVLCNQASETAQAIAHLLTLKNCKNIREIASKPCLYVL